MAEYRYPLSKVAPEDLDRNQRAVQAVCDWGRDVQCYLTVDDASAIVQVVVQHWKAASIHEAVRDEQLSHERMRQLAGF